MKYDLDVIRQAIEERDMAIEERDEIARNYIYKGNSIAWWHSKATDYRDALGRCWAALGELGVKCDGKTDVATAILSLKDRLK